MRQSKSFTDQEALQQHLIDYVAKDASELLKDIDSKTITRFDGKTLLLHTSGAHIVDYEMSLKEVILSFLMDPNISFLILMIGLAAIYAELNHPGAIIPGVVGIIFVVLAVFALNLLPLRFAGVALILTAFILFALEAKFATHGALGIGGIAVMILGALLLVDGPIPDETDETEDRSDPLLQELQDLLENLMHGGAPRRFSVCFAARREPSHAGSPRTRRLRRSRAIPDAGLRQTQFLSQSSAAAVEWATAWASP